MKFRKKPVVIEAVRVDHALNAPQNRPEWLVDALRDGTVHLSNAPTEDFALYVRTMEGVMQAGLGDWLIRGVAGELYPCKPDIFDATYEAVED